MLKICETCPNRMDCPASAGIPLDGAAVLVDESGLYFYVTNEFVDGRWSVEKGEIHDRDGTTFPDLTEAFEDCEGPVTREIEIPMRGIRNMLRGRKEMLVVDSICPAFALNLDTRTAQTVKAYFNRDPRSE